MGGEPAAWLAHSPLAVIASTELLELLDECFQKQYFSAFACSHSHWFVILISVLRTGYM